MEIKLIVRKPHLSYSSARHGANDAWIYMNVGIYIHAYFILSRDNAYIT